MTAPTHIRQNLDSTNESEMFEQASARLTTWISRCMAEWFDESWAKPIFPSKFDRVVGLPRMDGDEPIECEIGEGYCLGVPGAQVSVDWGRTYWMDRDERTEGERFFRIAEGTLHFHRDMPAPPDNLNLFRICLGPLPGRKADQPGVSIKGWWNIPPAAHEIAVRVWEETGGTLPE